MDETGETTPRLVRDERVSCVSCGGSGEVSGPMFKNTSWDDPDIVAAYGYGFRHRLRNFGDYQSAAIEFARYCRDNFNEQNVKSFASTYRAGAKYSYPEIKHGRLNLSRQRHTE